MLQLSETFSNPLRTQETKLLKIPDSSWSFQQVAAVKGCPPTLESLQYVSEGARDPQPPLELAKSPRDPQHTVPLELATNLWNFHGIPTHSQAAVHAVFFAREVPGSS